MNMDNTKVLSDEHIDKRCISQSSLKYSGDLCPNQYNQFRQRSNYKKYNNDANKLTKFLNLLLTLCILTLIIIMFYVLQNSIKRQTKMIKSNKGGS